MPSDKKINPKLLRDELYQILKKSYNKYGENMYIELHCFGSETQSDFINSDEKMKENTIFVKLEDFPRTKDNSWGVNLKVLFRIENFAFKNRGGQ